MGETTLVPLTPSDSDAAIGSQESPSAGAVPAPAVGEYGSAGWTVEWGPVALIGALLVMLYHGIAVKLVTDWYELPDFSHGFLIPFFVAFLIWDNRREFQRTALAPSWAGTVLVVLGLFALLIGRLGADLFFQRISFVVLIAGLVWTLLGKPMLRRSVFVLFVILLAIPLPTILFNQITFPLQLRASQFASDILPLLGVPVLRDGNIIQLPAMPLEVAEACSGIRSLMSLFTVAVIYGYFLERATWRRVLLALSSLPIAVTANVARIVGTGLCVQYWDPVKAMGFFHEFSGWLMFLVSLGCLYLVHMTMQIMAGKEAAAA